MCAVMNNLWEHGPHSRVTWSIVQNLAGCKVILSVVRF